MLALGALAAALGVPATAGPAPAAERAGDAPAPPEIYEARAEAGGVTDSLSVPALFETFTPYSLSEADNSSSHGLQGVFYPGFLLSAAQFQSGFGSSTPGSTETLYPQGPTEGTHDFPAFPDGYEPGGDGRAGGSSGASTATGSSGEAHYGGFTPPGDLAVESAVARTGVTAAEVVRSRADIVLGHVRIGGFSAEAVVATAEATAGGSPGAAAASGTARLVGATFMGTPVTLTPTGLRAGDQSAGLPGAPPLDQALAQAGITVKRLPDTVSVSPDGTEARFDIGGIEVRLSRPQQEFGLSFTLGRASVLARALRPTIAAAEPPVEAPSLPEVTPVKPPGPVDQAATVEPARAFVRPAPGPTERIVRRIVTGPAPAALAPALPSPAVPTPVPTRAGPSAAAVAVTKADWSGLSGLLILAAPAALVIRRILRMAAAP